jgi:glucose-6-phosphate 1-epimerase
MSRPSLSPSSASGSHATLLFHGQEAVQLCAGDGTRALVLLHGGQLLSWRSAQEQERLYLSGQATYDGVQAVRGGVPVVFPQFADHGPLSKHGFARHQTWQLLHAQTTAQDGLVVLGLASNPQTLAAWPFEFELELTIRVSSSRLDMELAVLNSGHEPCSFTAALHTYLAVPDVREARLHGLKRLRYRDSVAGTEQVDSNDAVQVAGELDRIYFDAAAPLSLKIDAAQPAPWRISQTGFSDVVVWNPGPTKAASLPDMREVDWSRMLCVEAARVGAPLVLQAGEQWLGRQTIDCEVVASQNPA